MVVHGAGQRQAPGGVVFAALTAAGRSGHSDACVPIEDGGQRDGSAAVPALGGVPGASASAGCSSASAGVCARDSSFSSVNEPLDGGSSHLVVVLSGEADGAAALQSTLQTADTGRKWTVIDTAVMMTADVQARISADLAAGMAVVVSCCSRSDPWRTELLGLLRQGGVPLWSVQCALGVRARLELATAAVAAAAGVLDLDALRRSRERRTALRQQLTSERDAADVVCALPEDRAVAAALCVHTAAQIHAAAACIGFVVDRPELVAFCGAMSTAQKAALGPAAAACSSLVLAQIHDAQDDDCLMDQLCNALDVLEFLEKMGPATIGAFTHTA